jgi:hypothetical protein
VLASGTQTRAITRGLAETTEFWRMLWWSVLVDVPSGMSDIDCPVLLAQGTCDLLSGGQTPRYLLLVQGRASICSSGPATLRTPTPQR